MPTIAQILQRADDYETKAKALRVAAAELNGHAESSAVAQMPTRIAKALKLRQPPPPPAPEPAPAPPPEPHDGQMLRFLRLFVRGPMKKTQAQAATQDWPEGLRAAAPAVRYKYVKLTAKGYKLTKAGRILVRRAATNGQPIGTKAKKGDMTAAIVATLRQAAKPLSFTELQAHIRGLTAQSVGSANRYGKIKAIGPRGKYRRWSPVDAPLTKTRGKARRAVPARRAAPAPRAGYGGLSDLITDILREHGEPLTVAALSMEARARGRTQGLTGLVNYVKRGSLVQHEPDATHPKRRYGLPA